MKTKPKKRQKDSQILKAVEAEINCKTEDEEPEIAYFDYCDWHDAGCPEAPG